MAGWLLGEQLDLGDGQTVDQDQEPVPVALDVDPVDDRRAFRGTSRNRLTLDWREGLAGLLDDVGQLVDQQALTIRAVGVVRSGTEHDVAADGEGAGAERACRLLRLRAGVDPDGGKLMIEAPLYIRAGGAIQGAACRPQLLLHRRMDTKILPA